jgi:cell division protein FtsL
MVTIGKQRVGWLGCLVVLIIAAGIVAGATLLVHKVLSMGKYTATALLRVSMQEKPIVFATDATAAFDRDRFEIYKNTQRQLMVSRFVLLAALRNPAVARIFPIHRELEKGDAVKWLQKRICIQFPGNGELMEVRFARNDPEEALVVLRAVVDAYLHEVVNVELDQRRLRLSELDKAVAATEMDARTRREELRKLETELGTAAKGTLALKQKLVVQDLDSARTETLQVRSDLRHLKSDLASQQALLKNADIFGKLPEAVKVEKLATIQVEVKRLEAAIAATTAEQQNLEQEVHKKRSETTRFDNATVDQDMLRADIKDIESTLAALRAERDRVRLECRCPARVSLLVAPGIGGL